MEQIKEIAGENIRLRAKAPDKALIDQAAELLGTSRTQFMMASALNAAKNVLIDQTTVYADSKAFNDILNWMEKPAPTSEKEGMQRLQKTKLPWQSD